MISIVYISRSLIDPAERPRVLDDILTVATDHNSILGIGGLLVASPHHFAQLIEGPGDSVEALITRIAADPRHTALRIIRKGPIIGESCGQWRMARFDQGNFGTSIIDPLLMAVHAGNEAQAIARLDSLIDRVLHAQQPKYWP